MDTRPIPDFAEGLRALKAVQAFFPGAMLAGGYLRDLFFGKLPKDIDIFVPHTPVGDLPKYHELQMIRMTGAAEYIEQSEVDDIFDVPGFELPVQVIMLRRGLDPVDRIKAHDFNFCQVWHDGTRLFMQQAFWQSVDKNEVVLEHCEDQTQFDRSMRRWVRIGLRYPEMKLVVPERFRQYEAVSDFT